MKEHGDGSAGFVVFLGGRTDWLMTLHKLSTWGLTAGFFLLFQMLATLPDCQIPTTPAGLDLSTGSVFIFLACCEILSFCKYLIFLSVGNAGSMNAVRKPGISGICD